ncbi:MAG TPA: hypothetical protein VKM55_30685 [Candidatus Lokiarchaeia archaeon]|nr:hypothetical protein [Candidatus Lokiarchaeia archaeon]
MCAKKATATVKSASTSKVSANPAARKEKAINVLRDAFEKKLKEATEVLMQLPEGALVVDEIPADAAYTKTIEIAKALYDEILDTGRPGLDVPSRSSSNIIYDENNDLLLLGQKINKKIFHSLSSVEAMTQLVRVLEIVNQLLQKHIHATKREVFYNDVNLFHEQTNSDNSIEDLSTVLHTIRNSTNIVASAMGKAVGRLRIKDQTDIIDLEAMGSGGWAITPFLDNVEIIESDAEFVLVIEKDAAMMRLSEAKWWKEYPCIIISGRGAADIATRMFLKKINKILNIPTFCLVDSDPYGHYIFSIYLRGSKKLSYESPFLATPNIHLLGVLTRDLDSYTVPKECRIPMNKTDLKRCQEMLNEDFVKKNKNWVTDLELMMKVKEKAEIQSLSAHGFEYLTEEYLPSKISTADWI